MTQVTGMTGWKRILVAWGPVLLYAGVIFILSSRSHPEEDLPSWFSEYSDKLWHLVEYAGLGGLCYRALRWGTTPAIAARAVIWAMAAAALYGATDELHQALVPFREAGWQDWLADAVGAAMGASVAGRLPRTLLLLPSSPAS